MAIAPRTPVPPFSTAGTGYAATYLKKKAELLEEKKKWAELELKEKYKSEVAYRTELKQMYEDIEKEQNALRKEREQFTLKSRDLEIKARKAGGVSGDERTKLIAQRQEAASALAKVGAEISGQRVDLVTKAEGLFDLPSSVQDQMSRALADSTLYSDVQIAQAGGADAEAEISNFIQRTAGLDTAFSGLTQEQKYSAGLDLFQKTAQTVIQAKGGAALTGQEEQTIKDEISAKYGIPAGDIDGASIAARKRAKTDEYVRKAGTDTQALKDTIAKIDAMLAPSGPLTGEAAIADSLANAGLGETLDKVLISSLKNDGVITADEAAFADDVINKAIAAEIARSPYLTEPEVRAVVNKEYGTNLRTDRNALENYYFQNVNEPVIQTYAREGSLETRKGTLAGPLPTRIDPSMMGPEAIARRTGELYYPVRSRRGFGETMPYYSQENATRRRAIEQGIPLEDEALATAGALGKPFAARGGTVGRQAPVPPQKRYSKADEMYEYMKAVRVAAKEGRVDKRVLNDIGQEAYDRIMSGIKDGSIKPEQIYDQVSSVTTANPDIVAAYGSPDLARKSKEDILYNIVGTQYEQYLADKPRKPEDTGVDLASVGEVKPYPSEPTYPLEPELPAGSVGVGAR